MGPTIERAKTVLTNFLIFVTKAWIRRVSPFLYSLITRSKNFPILSCWISPRNRKWIWKCFISLFIRKKWGRRSRDPFPLIEYLLEECLSLNSDSIFTLNITLNMGPIFLLLLSCWDIELQFSEPGWSTMSKIIKIIISKINNLKKI